MISFSLDCVLIVFEINCKLLNGRLFTGLKTLYLNSCWLLSVQAWLNEKFSPDLLPHHSEIVDCMMEQLNVMQHNIDRARKADLKVSIHKMEVRLVDVKL